MTRINLLPPEQRAKASREQGIMLVVLGLVALVLVLGAVYFLTLQKVSSHQDDVKAAQEQVDQVNVQIAGLKSYETLETQRVSMAETVKGLYDSRVLWSAILEEVSLVIPDTVDLTTMSCTVPQNMLAGTATESGAAPTVGISFAGEAESYRDVGEFITRLGLLPQIMNPRLATATASPPQPGQQSVVLFQVTVGLRPFLAPPPVMTLPVAPVSTQESTGGATP